MLNKNLFRTDLIHLEATRAYTNNSFEPKNMNLYQNLQIATISNRARGFL